MLNANPSQQEAIEHVDGPLLIIAGPGSGTTYTLVERIIHLIIEHDVEPESLLVVTLEFAEQIAVASGMKYKMIGGNAVTTADGYNNLFN